MINPLEDDSRWALMGARFDNSKIKSMFDEMFQEWLATLAPDDPARLLHDALAKIDVNDIVMP